VTTVSFSLVADPDGSGWADFDRLETRLLAEFSPPLHAEEVRRRLLNCIASYQSAVVRSYLPLLIERTTREQLRVLIARRQP